MTLGNMRSLGVRSLDHVRQCDHEAVRTDALILAAPGGPTLKTS